MASVMSEGVGVFATAPNLIGGKCASYEMCAGRREIVWDACFRIFIGTISIPPYPLRFDLKHFSVEI